ncbi:MAG TPA: hypothetical protein VIM73_04980 [Polyangiaceae bacterium]
MASIDIDQFERRARAQYEWARAKRAIVGLAPFSLVAAAAAFMAERPAVALVLGGVVFVWAALLLWYGREPRRAVLPGIGAGLVPLTFALCATLVEHGCMGDGCLRVCIPACAIGGVVAGLTVAGIGHRRRQGAAFWISASAIALLTGAMGCASAGYVGVGGMLVGYAAGLVPSGLRALFGAASK